MHVILISVKNLQLFQELFGGSGSTDKAKQGSF